MSAEEAVTDALQTPLDSNAQAAEETKKLLAEMQNESGPSNAVKHTNGDTNGAKSEDRAPKEEKVDAGEKDESEDKPSLDRSRDSDRHRDNRHRDNDRSDRRGQRPNRGRGRGGSDRNGYGNRNYRDNIKSVFTDQQESSDPVAIRKQVEFYFSDSNLPKDKFLFEQTGGSENKPVPLSAIHSFKRMRHFQPFSAIVDALKESTFLELAEDDTAVRRQKAWEPTVDNTGAMRRSIYAKGFGEEVPSTQFDIEAYFSEFGATNEVRLRRSDEKLFKGSVFVEFETEELAKAFLEQENKPKFKDNDLQVMSKKEYCDKKNEDIKAGRLKPNTTLEKGGRPYDRDRRGGDSKRKRDNEDNRDWRSRRDEDQKRGFGNDRRRGGGDRHRGSGYGGGRSSGPATDDRGIPTVKSSSENDNARDDALAKARAAVEAENKKEATEKVDVEASETKKRAREDDDSADADREAKKVDVKDGPVAAS